MEDITDYIKFCFTAHLKFTFLDNSRKNQVENQITIVNGDPYFQKQSNQP